MMSNQTPENTGAPADTAQAVTLTRAQMDQRAGQYNRIESLKRDLEGAQDQYLRMAGWQMTCNNPGALWLWTNGRFTLPKGDALYMQERMDYLVGVFDQENADVEF